MSWRPALLLSALLLVPVVAADEVDGEDGQEDGCKVLEWTSNDPSLTLYPVLGVWRLDIDECIDDIITDSPESTELTRHLP